MTNIPNVELFCFSVELDKFKYVAKSYFFSYYET